MLRGAATLYIAALMLQLPIIMAVKALILLFSVSVALPTFGVEEGLASWYGGKFHGRLTSSGEVFNTHGNTAAHRTLPFGTIVKVTNLENGKSSLVKINDRGPFVEGRIIDLSFAAAQELDMVNQGVARVSLEIVQLPSEAYHVQVGAFGVQSNAAKAQKTLEQAGFLVAVEKTPFGITRVFASGLAEKDLPAAQKRLEALGFTQLLVMKEPADAPQAVAQ